MSMSIDWQGVHDFAKQEGHDEVRMWIKLIQRC